MPPNTPSSPAMSMSRARVVGLALGVPEARGADVVGAQPGDDPLGALDVGASWGGLTRSCGKHPRDPCDRADEDRTQAEEPSRHSFLADSGAPR